MSGYGPGGSQMYTKPIPPQRGSFPLDHDGECKHVMSVYLACLKKVKGVNDNACRELAKEYLSCRMDRNLMARDDFKNLGFQTPGQTAQKEAKAKAAAEGASNEPKRV